ASWSEAEIEEQINRSVSLLLQ
ncbi:hypothetical protein MJI40_24230, partial [Salmonella enterica subsp. enterica serovar Montevideo]|nr:hypothetical protein [Salmonella enterica subsp. enterica serovar Montevideo]